MRILAVETSCDDSAVALLEDSSVIAERIYSQSIHSNHGGVVPELASRQHIETLPGLVREVLSESGIDRLREIDVFAATAGPGLVGSLLVGLSWTKAAAFASGKQFLGINHLSAHLHTHYTGSDSVEFPAVALLVSGGHTCLFSMKSWTEAVLLGSTRDDAAGEAFDKTAKLAGLGYPGGEALERAAIDGNPDNVPLPSPLSDPTLPEFSFSGLKTAVKLQWESGANLSDLAASFQKVIVDILVSKLIFQAVRSGAASVLVAGGVTANTLLRTRLRGECADRGISLFLPEKKYSMDNAVMVGRAAFAVLREEPSSCSSLSCNAFSRWSGSILKALCCT
ncbi:MAG: tRNA (adenosine(37)-N6)-threonylcarbamoyltransferase complex transferase subunit TsaD [Candidatus Fermentibacteraceae bacterium]|nr:tRNA (adenosine(37)-N6)-threonylcarbamoyltransferase complex transferase subunit TsaD [Candidatus Fermentibacteraceae bacterium]